MIRDELITLRVLIAKGAPAEQIEPVYQSLLHAVEQLSGPFRALMLDALRTCHEHLAAGSRDEALREIQLIHNLPTSDADLETWDEDHFFQVELIAYLESECNVRRIKRVVSLLGALTTHA
jgi:hypothetical protein